MTVTRKVYVNWNNDGVTFTDMSAYVISVSGTIGRLDARTRVADVGMVTIEFRNDDKRFSPEFTAGPYYGQLVPNIPVRVEVTDTTGTHRLFTVFTMDWEPQPDQYGPLRATVTCMDRMGQLQDADISLPIQEGLGAGEVLKKVTSDAYDSGVASGTMYMRNVANGNEITIGTQVYTFKSALTPTDNEIALESQNYFFNEGAGGGGVTDAAVNAAAAINRDERSGTDYAAGTNRHASVTALGYMGIGRDESFQDTELYLQRTGTAYEAIATQFAWNYLGGSDEPEDMPMRRVYLYLKKVGSPTGVLTLQHLVPTGAGGGPSTTLYNANGTITMNEADLTTSFAWYAFDFPAEYDMNYYSLPGVSFIHWLALSTNRATSGTDYVVWGQDAVTTAARFAIDTKTGGAWTGRTAGTSMIFSIPGLLDIEANAHGAWGNTIELSTAGMHRNAATVTLTTGTLISGALADTFTENQVYYTIGEVTGTPGFDVSFDTTVTGIGLELGIVVRYEGSIGHTVTIGAWNGTTWDTLQTLVAGAGDQLYLLALTAAHTITGNVKIRVYHSSPGNAAHVLYIDHVYILDSIATSVTGIAVDSVVLTGGVDGPVGAIDYEAGELTFDYAGDTWIAGETNALTAVQEMVESEFGLFWAAKDGTLTFRDHHYQFELLNTTAALTLNDDQTGQTGRLSKNDIINRSTVSYRPRSVAASAVIAKITQPVKVPGRNSKVNGRWNKTREPRNAAGEKTVIVPYVDQGTAEKVGGIDIVQPLTPTTDFTVYDTKDKSGFNYTAALPLIYAFAFALVGSGVQVHIRNTATGPIWIHDLQISGSALVRQDTTQEWVEDATSRAAYGLKAYDYTITFPSSSVDEFAYSLATYWVNVFKDPFYNIDSITIRGTETINGVSVFDLEIGDMIVVSETQTAVNAYKMMIIGLDVLLPEKDTHSITYYVQRLDINPYWFIEVAGYSELGVTTYLGL